MLIVDIPRLSLRQGDRLEPHRGLQDTWLFDSIDTFPCAVLFWRPSHETRARHRLPRFDPSVGITVDTLMVDKLHTLYLGPAQTWSCHALWRLILVDAFNVGGTAEHYFPLAVAQIKNELWAWYRDAKRRRPAEELTQVHNFTLSMLGNKPTSQALGTKAAETKGLLPVALSLLENTAPTSHPEKSSASSEPALPFSITST